MNQHSHRVAILVAIVATITLVASACGDSTADVGAPSDVAPTTAPSTAAPATVAPPDGPLGSGPYPIADIAVEIHADGTKSPVISSYRLSCLGDTATVIGDAQGSAAQMCLAVDGPDVRSLLVFGAPTDRICTEIYGGPDVAVFTGTLDGDAVDFTADRVNGCAIFEWDNTLTGLLPRPVPMQ